MYENLFVLFVLVPVLAVVLALGAAAVWQWSQPVSKRRSVPLRYTREARVSEAVRAAEAEARWVRLVKYSHWLEDGNPICKMHEKSYARMLRKSVVDDLVREINREDADALEIRSAMRRLKEFDYFAWQQVVEGCL